MSVSRLFFIALVFTIFGTLFGAASASASGSRPPQFVLLAFDGSSSIPMWEETRDFARRAKAKGAPVKFTYFISGVYYVGKANRKKYIEPTRGAGVSAIGWGDDAADLLARYDQTNLAAIEEHEIASHANAHFSGDKWTVKEWSSEFTQFHSIIFDFFNFNGVRPSSRFPNGWVFKEDSMTGFRAPQLGVSKGLWDVIRAKGYRYDTSLVAKANYWPERHVQGGHWNFPLAALTIAGTGKRTLSMDYNFYVADSAAKPNPAQKARFKNQMIETYLQYFEGNYNGNRAPVHIGHHFSKWNDGAYWEAMQEFALAVCGRPEVQCVTYRELADFMDSKKPQEIEAYRRGAFDKLPSLRLAQGLPTYDLGVRMVASSAAARTLQGYSVELRGRDGRLGAGDRIETRLNGGLVQGGGAWRQALRGQNAIVETRILRAGQEIARATQILSQIGLPSESISEQPVEARALLGDLPEAHAEGEGPRKDHGH